MQTSNGAKIHASTAGTFALGGVTPVARIGYGAMRITGPGIIGEPADVNDARRVLRRAVELGVTFIDTAHAYGPLVSERLFGEALSPYADDLVIATKGGLDRDSRGAWLADGSPAKLRAQLQQSLSLLRIETVDRYQLHTVDRPLPPASTSHHSRSRSPGSSDARRTCSRSRHILGGHLEANLAAASIELSERDLVELGGGTSP